MKMTRYSNQRRAVAVLAASLALGGIIGTASGQMYRMQTLGSGGGVPAAPVLNAPVPNGTNVTLSWYGPMGWYTIQGSTNLGTTGPWNNFTTVEATSYAWQATIPDPNSYDNFQLSVPNPYAGSTACGGCHGAEYTPWTATVHANAYNDLVNSGEQNASCVLCHTVGFNQPTGFSTNSPVASLEGVGCEACHGPASWHKNSDHAVILPAVSVDPAICGSCHQGRNPQYNEYTNSLHYPTVAAPVSSIGQAASCGLCHSAAVRMAMISDYANRLNGYTNALVMPTLSDAQAWGPSCAICHDPHGLTPSPVFGYVTNIVAGVSTNVVWTNVYNTYVQLRNPLWSSNFYTMPAQADTRKDSSSNTYYMNTTFSSMYNPSINVCGQCHNTRGARWDGRSYGLITNVVSVTNSVISAAYTNTYTTNYNRYGQIVGVLTNIYPTGGTMTNTVITNLLAVTTGLTTNITGFSRAPHFSPQYNMLIGILQPDYLNSTNGKTFYTNGILNNGIGIYATHSGIVGRSPYNTNQCATCHVPSYTGSSGNVTGHTFNIDPNGCALGGCHNSTSHGTPGAPDYIEYAIENSNVVVSVADLLNTWATTQATNYISLASYNKSLQNSWEYTSPGSLASITNSGPSTSDQLLLPTAIQQARFDIYMVYSDGTFEAHNPTFIPMLIKDAETKVLSQLPVQFTAKSTYGGPGASITFSNLTSGVSTAAWNFGDGGSSTSTATTVTHSYTNAGVYPVSLTVNGANALTRNNYINIYVAPTNVSFTCSSIALTRKGNPLSATATFTNTTANANFGNWAIYSGAVVNTANIVGGMASPVNIPQFFAFTNAGTYTIVFTTSNPGGSVAVTNSSYITVQ
jgi:PKD repeat protein